VSWKHRALAFAIDAALLMLALLAGGELLTLLAATGWLPPAVDAAAKPLGWLLSLVLVVAFWKAFGATPGKMVFSAEVVDAKTGERVGLVQGLIRGLGLLASALPAGAGFIWGAMDAQGQALHDKLAGTRVVLPPIEEGGEAAPETAQPRSVLDYLRLHWQGELPVATSLCVNTLLLLFPLVKALVWLSVLVNVKGEAMRVGSALLLVLWPLMLVALIWGVMGSWRAIQTRAHLGLDVRLALSMQGLLALVAGTLVWTALVDFAPRVTRYVALVQGTDPIGHASLSLSADGQRVVLSGPIGMSDATRFMTLARQAPQARTLEIESSGGRLHEARQMAELLRSQGWRTRAVGDCEGACTLVFLAGTQRLLTPGVALGLHGPAPGILKAFALNAARRALAEPYEALGVPAALVQQMLETPDQLRWHPSREQLADEGLVELPPLTLDIKLPADRQHRTATELTELLRDNPAWYELDLLYPGTVNDAVAHMLSANADPASDEAALLAQAHGVFVALLPRLLQETSGEERVRYLPIWKQQLESARASNPALCTSLLSGNAAARRGLPDEVAALEAVWIVEAAPPAVGQVGRPVNAVEKEVIKHALGDNAPEIISSLLLKAQARNARLDCGRSIEILEAVAGMPLNTRQIAARALFQSPEVSK
jgi:uncharacterized RDD family membrane protein YckC